MHTGHATRAPSTPTHPCQPPRARPHPYQKTPTTLCLIARPEVPTTVKIEVWEKKPCKITIKPTKSKLLLLKSQRKPLSSPKNTVIYFEGFKSKQLTFEIGPEGPKRTKSRTHGGGGGGNVVVVRTWVVPGRSLSTNRHRASTGGGVCGRKGGEQEGRRGVCVREGGGMEGGGVVVVQTIESRAVCTQGLAPMMQLLVGAMSLWT